MPGGAANLTCVAVGSPMPWVKWRRGAEELTPEDNPPVGKNVLQLHDIRESANYTCVAASELGHIEAIGQVKVKGIPPLYLSSVLLQDKNTYSIVVDHINRVYKGNI